MTDHVTPEEARPTFIDGIGPPLEQIWEDYGCEDAVAGNDSGDVRALILAYRSLAAQLVEARQRERVLREAATEARGSLGRGTLRDGYAYRVLDEALSDTDPQEKP